MDYKVLITTAGTGSRLGPLTKNLNKALVKVNGIPTIEYILDRYHKSIPLVIALGYLKDQVKDYLLTKHSDRKFEFTVSEVFEGPGSSCGYTILKSRDSLQCPFIFHACDTIVFDDIPAPDTNWTAGYINSHIDPDVVMANFTTHKTNNLDLMQVNPLGESDYSHIHIGITAIKDYLPFWENLASLYQSDPQNSKLTDIHVINKMLEQGYKFTIEPFSVWLDTGNPNTFAYTEKYLKEKAKGQ